MRKLTALVACAFLVAGPAAAGASLDIRKLTRLASKASGLRVRSRPKITVVGAAAMQQEALRLLDRDYPVGQQAYDETLYRALGLLPGEQQLRPSLLQQAQAALGLYDPVARTIDVRFGKMLRPTLLRELVTALEDQEFSLRRLSGIRPGRRDAALAGGAIVDAYAAFATGARARRVAPVARTTPPLGTFLAIENRFATTTAVRFVGALQAIGGRRAAFTALRRFPTTSEQLLHVDAFLAHEPAAPVSLPTVAGKFGLERQDSFGELDVRALLQAFGVAGVDRIATGWGGGRSAVYRDTTGRQAVVLALDWDENADADEWTTTIPVYLQARSGPAATSRSHGAALPRRSSSARRRPTPPRSLRLSSSDRAQPLVEA